MKKETLCNKYMVIILYFLYSIQQFLNPDETGSLPFVFIDNTLFLLLYCSEINSEIILRLILLKYNHKLSDSCL